MERRKSIKILAYEILKMKGKPLNYRELVNLIMKKRELKGDTPDQTVISILIRSPTFKRMGRGVYGLAEWNKKI